MKMRQWQYKWEKNIVFNEMSNNKSVCVCALHMQGCPLQLWMSDMVMYEALENDITERRYRWRDVINN